MRLWIAASIATLLSSNSGATTFLLESVDSIIEKKAELIVFGRFVSVEEKREPVPLQIYKFEVKEVFAGSIAPDSTIEIRHPKAPHIPPFAISKPLVLLLKSDPKNPGFFLPASFPNGVLTVNEDKGAEKILIPRAPGSASITLKKKELAEELTRERFRARVKSIRERAGKKQNR